MLYRKKDLHRYRFPCYQQTDRCKSAKCKSTQINRSVFLPLSLIMTAFTENKRLDNTCEKLKVQQNNKTVITIRVRLII